MDFNEIWYWLVLMQFVNMFQFWLKFVENDGLLCEDLHKWKAHIACFYKYLSQRVVFEIKF
jgi:hypothetical protein